MAFFLCIMLQASLWTVHTYLISPDKIGLSITIPTMWISGKCQIESLSMITCEYLVHRFLSLLCSFSFLNCSVRNGVSFWKIFLEAALEDYGHLLIDHAPMLMRRFLSMTEFSQQGFEASHKDQRQLWLKATSHDQHGEASSSKCK